MQRYAGLCNWKGITWIIRQSLMEETAMPIEMTFDKHSDQNVQNNMGAQERERLTLWGGGEESRQASQKR